MDETDKISVGRGAEEAPDASETPGTAGGAQLEESARETAPADESDCAEDGGEWDDAAADDTPDEWDAEPDGGFESPAAQPGGERFVLKHLGETFEVSRDELIRLAQKGRDYDRIRGRAESLAGRLGGAERANEALGLLARKRGMTAEQYADSLRAESLAAERGVSRAEAVTLVRRERAAAQRPRDEELAVERQAAAFAAEYPDVDPAAIPGEVWTAAGSGAGLLGAYRRYELQSLRSRVRELETSAGNAARSTGSRASDGGAGEIETDWLGG